MTVMWRYPEIDPVAFSLMGLQVHWYGLMYLVGFLSAWRLGIFRSKKAGSVILPAQVADAVSFGALGAVLGGRLGYLLFYDFQNFVHDPLIFIRLWEGGMSFHGGLLGVCLAGFLYAKKIRVHPVDLLEFFAPMVPIGLAAGRLGNFINGELWGKVTTSPLGMIFPGAGPLPRFPSQLLEMLLEGVFLFALLWGVSLKRRPRYAISGCFLLAYGLLRFVAEFFREPDIGRGYLAWGWLTEGQLLSVPMILLGIFLCAMVGVNCVQHREQE